MSKSINNMEQLAAALMPVMKDMVGELAERVYETLNFFLQEYYSSYHPISYRRQYDFLRSAVKVEPKTVGNKVVADTDSMDSYYNATGEQVATWANEGLHGGLDVGKSPHVWDDTVDETVNNGELLKLAIKYLRNKGISVRV